jgi:hypothetical protein
MYVYVYVGLEYSTPKREWDDDRKATRCSVCGVSFSVTVRRHHCRRCGILVCDKDGNDRLALPGGFTHSYIAL